MLTNFYFIYKRKRNTILDFQFQEIYKRKISNKTLPTRCLVAARLETLIEKKKKKKRNDFSV